MKRKLFLIAVVVLMLAASLSAWASGSIVGWGGQVVGVDLSAGFVAVAAGCYHSLGLKSDGSIVAWGANWDGQCNVPTPNIGFVAIAAGEHHSLGLKSDGSIAAWGTNGYGQCSVPSPNTGFVAIAAGEYHSLGLKADGSIVAWGYNYYGQCSVPSPNTGFVAIAVGGRHSLGLKSGGSIVAWGYNYWGQCDVLAPNSGFVAIAAGASHSLGLKSGGSIVAWGYNDSGQCSVPSPNSGFVAVAAGASHSLGLKADGSIAAWGWNGYGQCSVPSPNSGFVAIAAGYDHSLGLKSDGSIAAWGWNGCGQCNVPSPNTGFVAVAAGRYHSLGLRSDGSIVAWGDNGDGECNVPAPNSGFVAIAAGYCHSLGLKSDGSIAAWGSSTVPSPNSEFVAIAAGWDHSLGLKSDGSIAAWGRNFEGQCSVPSPNTGFVAVAAGYGHSLGLKSDGSIAAWGDDLYGVCSVPAPNTGFVALAAGGWHSLGLKADGSIVAWGYNGYGVCSVPSPNSGFVGVAAGAAHSLGLKADGSIAAWGWNEYGQCSVPAPNAGFAAVAGGYSDSLGIRGTGAPPPPPPSNPVRAANPYTPPSGETLHRLKGQMHAHWFCDWGAGWYRNWRTKYPHQVLEIYEGSAYDFVCLTEHNHSTYSLTSGNTFTLDYCSEVTTYDAPNEPWYHVLAIGSQNATGYGTNIPFADTGPDRDPRWDDGLPWLEEVPFNTGSGYGPPYYSAQATINRIVNMGGLAFIPHPDQIGLGLGKNFNFDAMIALLSGSKLPTGIAIRTAACGEDAIGLWDQLLRVGYSTCVGAKRYPLFGYAEDDYTPGVPFAQCVDGSTWVEAHAYYPDGASVDVKRAKVKEALASGRFVSYWTNNGTPWGNSPYPQLNISVDTSGDRPVISVSTVGGVILDKIKFIGKKWWWTSDTLPNGYFENASSASYTCTGNEGYVRIEWEYKTSGKPRLWIASQPIWVYPEGRVEGPYQGALAPASVALPTGAPGTFGLMEETPELILNYVSPEDYPAASPPQGYIGFVYNVTSSTGSIPPGAVLTLSFAGEDLTAVGVENLAVYYFNAVAGAWECLPGTVHTADNTVSAQISSEGLYTISAELPEDTTPPQIYISRPTGETISGLVEFGCYVTDDLGVLRVQFYLNDRQVGEDVHPDGGWSCEVDTTPYVSGEYALKVVAEDASGNRGEATKTFAIESPTPPPTVAITSHSGGETFTGTVTMSGTCWDDEAVAEVWILVDGYYAAPAEVEEGNWTAELDTSLLVGGLRNVSAWVEDYYGNSAIASLQVNIDNTPVSLGTAKQRQDGESVVVAGCIVTAGTEEIGGAFYMQAADRSAGIRVATDRIVREGDIVSVAGLLGAMDGERQINASDVLVLSSSNPIPKPLGMPNRSLGGGDWQYDQGTGKGQKGVKDGSGLNNIGLLVTTWGDVVEIESVTPPALPTWFRIDDGSGVTVKCVVPSDVTIEDDWEYVVVTGVSSCEKVGDDLHRVLRVRDESDIAAY